MTDFREIMMDVALNGDKHGTNYTQPKHKDPGLGDKASRNIGTLLDRSIY